MVGLQCVLLTASASRVYHVSVPTCAATTVHRGIIALIGLIKRAESRPFFLASSPGISFHVYAESSLRPYDDHGPNNADADSSVSLLVLGTCR